MKDVYWWDMGADVFRRVRVLQEFEHTYLVSTNGRATFSVYKEDCILKA